MKTRIPELRRERKLSQEELARAVGTTRQTITSIEVGRYTASLPLAYKIAHYFGVLVIVLDVLIGEFWDELGFLHSYQMTSRARQMQSMLLFGFLVYFVVKLVGNKRRLKNLWQYEEEARWQKDERRIAADLALAGLVVATFVVSLYNMDAFNALYYTLLGFVLLRFGCWLYVRRKY